MAMPKPKKKDYHACEFCKLYPCMYVAHNEVEYKTRCRSYIPNTRKISNDKLQGRTKFGIPN